MKTVRQLLSGRNFQTRVLSSLVMIPVVLVALWWGGPPAILIAAVIAALIFYEWTNLTGTNRFAMIFWLCQALILTMTALLLLQANEFAATFWIVLVVLIGFIQLLFNNADSWKALGLLYALTFLVTILLLRQSPQFGFEAAVFVLVVVWVTDSFAYFTGNLIGGKKLLPKISPQKTRSGFYGGTIAAAITGGILAHVLKLPSIVMPVFIAVALALTAQVGDLFESWLKRRFNAKDSGNLIPGHGGVLDRLDSLVAASLLAYLIGAARTGLASPASGLLLW